MNPIVYRIQLDAGKPGSQLQINAKAGEHASRKIIATIFKDNEVFTPPSGATAALRAQSESGAKFYNACTISGCEIEYELGSNMLASACFISCEIVVIGANNEVLCSPGFDIYVEDILFSDAVVEQEDEFTALTTALSRVSNIEASEAGRVSAENARVAAETLRESAEEVRDASEDARVAAELERESAEELRVSNENARDTAEDARIAAELMRTSQESARESAEDSRDSAEAARKAAEQDRVSAESIRVSSEHTRETQESERQSNTASAVQNANAAADRANAAAKSCEDIVGGNYPSHASTHASGGSDPITPSSIGAAAADHTHTPESIGAAAADHTHTPESIGAAAADHTHTPESIGAVSVESFDGLSNYVDDFITNYQNYITPAGIGAATASHTHAPADIGAQAARSTFSSKSVATSAWASDTTYTDYPYRAAVACADVTANMFADVVLSPTDATGGNFAPVCDTYAGGVYLYAKAVPDAAITIPTIIVWR